MLTYLVTGCAGFIGAKVTEFLLADGHTAVGVDNLNDAYDVRLKHWRLAQLEGQPGFEFYRLDICDRPALADLFNSQFEIRNSKFDAMINLAARAGVRQSVANPWIYFETNVTGTLNLLELCREHGINKFILASTSSLYGASNPRPFREDADTDGPLSPYAASKKAAEALCYTYHYLYDMDVTVLRYFTVYGPAGRPDMSLFRFVQWISEGRPVIVYGDGSQSRDFTYVDDIARGTIAALSFLQSEIRNPKFEIINLGSDRPVVLMDAIRLVEELVGKKARIEHKPRHPADVLATWADIGKAERLLEWRPRSAFQDGVAGLVEWYRENRARAKEIQTG
ncbi:MAG TPA: NAD-dependent epimerase/dehydratase family protein [Anaerolineae bacterium]|nr:NAD-dependent epimerase/dehydratase family protein [Anaerolineae bacterium]